MASQSNFFDEEGYRYGAMFRDGSVSQTFNGRTQRERAEAYVAGMRKEIGSEVTLVRRTVDSGWEPVDRPPLVLGQRVKFERTLYRTHEIRTVPNPFNGSLYQEHWRVWKPSIFRKEQEGIVVGTRTLMNVERFLVGFEEGWDNNLATAERFQAVWVATDIRKKPVWVLPEDISHGTE